MAVAGVRDEVRGEASVTEIHGYPLRPEGFTEPLFLTQGHKKEIAEHLASSGWLRRADVASTGKTVGDAGQPCHVLKRGDGAWVVRREGGCSVRRHGQRLRKWRVREVVDRWREVSGWWEPGEASGEDRIMFRVLLAGEAGTVLDLAYERRERKWFVAAVVD